MAGGTHQRRLCSELGRYADRLLVAGQRPSASTADRQLPLRQLDLGLLGYLERVVNVNPEVADGAFELAVTE